MTQSTVPRGSESVLLVEPDAETRVLAAFMLGRLGYRVTEARNGAEAMKLHDHPDVAWDLLLTEAVMPRMNGHDLADVLRGRRPGLRVLFLADRDYERLARRAAALKGVEFLCRPFTMASLASRVRACLDNGRTMTAGNPS
jgi:DNA-binding response OmpR family regulator